RRGRGAVPQGQGGDAGRDHPRRVPRQALSRQGVGAAADRRSLEGGGHREGEVHRRLDGRLARHGGQGQLADQGARRRGAQGGAEADRAGGRGGERRRTQGGVHDRRWARQGGAGGGQGAVRRGERGAGGWAGDGDARDPQAGRQDSRRRVGEGEEEVSDEEKKDGKGN